MTIVTAEGLERKPTSGATANLQPPSFVGEPQQCVTAQEGTDIILTVDLAPSGGAPTAISWRRGDQELTGDRYRVSENNNTVHLNLHHVTRDDVGHYTLTAKNAAGETRRAIEIRVEDPGSDVPVFLRRLSDLAVKVGTRTRFLVEIRSSTDIKVSWHRNDQQLVEGERFHFVHEGNFFCVDVAPVMVEDGGRWTCMAEGTGGRASCSSHLNVLVPKAYKAPEFLEELQAILTEQGTVSLECKVVGVPTPVLRWYKDGKEIKAGDIFALTANPDDPTSLGTYTCEAVNCMGKTYSSSKVHVVGKGSREGSLKPADSMKPVGPPPVFKQELRNEKIKIGDTITLACQVTVPPWPQSITWYNKEGRVEESDKYHVMADGLGGYMIEINQAEAVDEGEWKCVATSNEGARGISQCHVSMTYPKNYRKPRFLESLKAILTDEGLVSFECKVVGFPTPQLRWFKDGQELKPGDVYQLTGTNSLGSYSCIAKNCMGEARSSAELTIEDIQNQLNEEERLQLFSHNQPPKFIQGLKSSEAKIAEDFRFTVQVSISPEPSILWYRDDEQVEETTRYLVSKETLGMCHLDVRSLEIIDQAEWKCVATNDFGHSVTSCFLKLIIPRHYKKPRFLECLRAILSEEGAVNLECKVIGVPQPVLKWYKDGQELKPGDIHRIISGQDGTCCLGTYTCEAQNCMGTVASSASLLGFEERLMKGAPQKVDQGAGHLIARNPSLSTIHEERTSQMYDTPATERSVTVDERAEVSFSFDGKEVSVSLYETPDLTEEEALQVVEMYADQLSEHVSEHNVVELPPLRFVKETSNTGKLLMEAVVIDVTHDAFGSAAEDDLRTDADLEELSITDDNGQQAPPLPQDTEEDEAHLEKINTEFLERALAPTVPYSPGEEPPPVPKRPPRKKAEAKQDSDTFQSLSPTKGQTKDSDTFFSVSPPKREISAKEEEDKSKSEHFTDAAAHSSELDSRVESASFASARGSSGDAKAFQIAAIEEQRGVEPHSTKSSPAELVRNIEIDTRKKKNVEPEIEEEIQELEAESKEITSRPGSLRRKMRSIESGLGRSFEESEREEKPPGEIPGSKPERPARRGSRSKKERSIESGQGGSFEESGDERTSSEASSSAPKLERKHSQKKKISSEVGMIEAHMKKIQEQQKVVKEESFSEEGDGLKTAKPGEIRRSSTKERRKSTEVQTEGSITRKKPLRSQSVEAKESEFEDKDGKLKKHRILSSSNVDLPTLQAAASERSLSEKEGSLIESLTRSLQDIQKGLASVEEQVKLQSGSEPGSAKSSLSVLEALSQPIEDSLALVERQVSSERPTKEQSPIKILETISQPIQEFQKGLALVEQQIEVEMGEESLLEKTSVSILENVAQPVQELQRDIALLQLQQQYAESKHEYIPEIKEEALTEEEIRPAIQTITQSIQELQRGLAVLQQHTVYEETGETSSRIDSVDILETLSHPLHELRRGLAQVEEQAVLEAEEKSIGHSILEAVAQPLQELQKGLELVEQQTISETEPLNLPELPSQKAIETLSQPIIELQKGLAQIGQKYLIETEPIKPLPGSLPVLKGLQTSIQELQQGIESVCKLSVLEEKTSKAQVHDVAKLESIKSLAQPLIQLQKCLTNLEISEFKSSKEHATASEAVVPSLRSLKEPLSTLQKQLTQIDREILSTASQKCSAESSYVLTVQALTQPLKNLQRSITILLDVSNSDSGAKNISALETMARPLQDFTHALVQIEQQAVLETAPKVTADTKSFATAKILTQSIHDLQQAIVTIDKQNILEDQEEPGVKTISKLADLAQPLSQLKQGLIEAVENIALEESKDISGRKVSSVAIEKLVQPLETLQNELVKTEQQLILTMQKAETKTAESVEQLLQPVQHLKQEIEYVKQQATEKLNEESPLTVLQSLVQPLQNLQMGVTVVAPKESSIMVLENVSQTVEALQRGVSTIEKKVLAEVKQDPTRATVMKLGALTEPLKELQKELNFVEQKIQFESEEELLSEVSSIKSLRALAQPLQELQKGLIQIEKYAIEPDLKPLAERAAEVLVEPILELQREIQGIQQQVVMETDEESKKGFTILENLAQPLRELQRGLSVVEEQNIMILEEAPIFEKAASLSTLEKVTHCIQELHHSIATIEHKALVESSIAIPEKAELSAIVAIAKPLMELHKGLIQVEDQIFESGEKPLPDRASILALETMAKPLQELTKGLAQVEEMILMEPSQELPSEKVGLSALETLAKPLRALQKGIAVVQYQTALEADSAISEQSAVFQTLAQPLQALQHGIAVIEEQAVIEPALQSITEKMNIPVYQKLVHSIEGIHKGIALTEKQAVFEGSDEPLSEMAAISLLQTMAQPLKELQKNLVQVEHQMVLEAAPESQSELTNLATLASPVRELQKGIALIEQHAILEPGAEPLTGISAVSLVQAIAKPIQDIRKGLVQIHEQVILEAREEPMSDKTDISILKTLAHPIQQLQKSITVIEQQTLLEPSEEPLKQLNISILETLAQPLKELHKNLIQVEQQVALEAGDRSISGDLQASVLETIAHPVHELQRGIALIQQQAALEAREVEMSEKSTISLLKTIAQPLEELQRGLARIEQQVIMEAPEELLSEKAEFSILKTLAQPIRDIRKSINVIEKQVVYEPVAEPLSEVTGVSMLGTLAVPLQELQQNLVQIQQVVLEAREQPISEKSISVLKTLAQPVHELERNIALIQQQAVLEAGEEEMTDRTSMSMLQTLAQPMQELQRGIAQVQQQIALESREEDISDKQSMALLFSLAKPMEEVCHNIALIQEQAILLGDAEPLTEKTSMSALETLAQPVQELLRGIAIVQEQARLEHGEDLSEKESLSILKTLAEPVHKLQRNIALIQQQAVLEAGNEDISERTTISMLQTLAQPVQEVQRCIAQVQHQIALEAREEEMSDKMSISILQALANPIQEFERCIALIQEQAVYEATEEPISDKTSMSALETLAEPVQELLRGIALVQEQAHMEHGEELSERENISILKTLAQPIAELHKGLTRVEQVVLEGGVENIPTEQYSVFETLAQPIQELQRGIAIIEKQSVLEAVEGELSEKAQISLLKELAKPLRELQKGIIMVEQQEILEAIAEPMSDDTTNISELPTLASTTDVSQDLAIVNVEEQGVLEGDVETLSDRTDPRDVACVAISQQEMRRDIAVIEQQTAVEEGRTLELSHDVGLKQVASVSQEVDKGQATVQQAQILEAKKKEVQVEQVENESEEMKGSQQLQRTEEIQEELEKERSEHALKEKTEIQEVDSSKKDKEEVNLKKIREVELKQKDVIEEEKTSEEKTKDLSHKTEDVRKINEDETARTKEKEEIDSKKKEREIEEENKLIEGDDHKRKEEADMKNKNKDKERKRIELTETEGPKTEKDIMKEKGHEDRKKQDEEAERKKQEEAELKSKKEEENKKKKENEERKKKETKVELKRDREADSMEVEKKEQQEEQMKKEKERVQKHERKEKEEEVICKKEEDSVLKKDIEKDLELEKEELKKEEEEIKKKEEAKLKAKKQGEEIQNKEKAEEKKREEEENKKKEESEIKKKKEEEERKEREIESKKKEEEDKKKEEAELKKKKEEEDERRKKQEKEEAEVKKKKEEEERKKKEEAEAKKTVEEEERKKESELKKKKEEEERKKKETEEEEKKKKDEAELKKKKEEEEMKKKEEAKLKKKKEEEEIKKKEEVELKKKKEEEERKKEEAAAKKKKEEEERKKKEEEEERKKKEEAETKKKVEEEERKKKKEAELKNKAEEEERKKKEEAESKKKEEADLKKKKEEEELRKKDEVEAKKKKEEEERKKSEAEAKKEEEEKKKKEEAEAKKEEERKKEEAEAKKKAEEEKKKKDEAELKKKKEEEEIKKKEEAELKKKKDEQERKKKEEAEAKKEEEEKKKKEEAEAKKKKEEEERKEEAAAKKKKEEEERKKKEEEERKKKEEAEAKNKAEEEKKKRDEAEKKKKKEEKEVKKKEETELKEKKEKEEAEAKKKEEEEKKKKEEEEKKKKEEEEKRKKEETETKKKNEEEEQKKKEEAEAKKKEEEENKKKVEAEAKKKDEEEKKKKEETETKKKKEEKERKKKEEAEAKKKEEAEVKKKEEAEAKKKKEEEERKKEEAEAKKKEEEEKKKKEEAEAKKKEEEKIKKKEEAEAKKKKEEEERKKEDAEAKKKAEEEKKKRDEAELKKKEEEEIKKKEEAELKKKKEEERKKVEAEEKKKKEEEERKKKEEAEAKNREEEKKKKEEAETMKKKEEEERKKKEEAEAKEKAEEEKKKRDEAELKRKKEEEEIKKKEEAELKKKKEEEERKRKEEAEAKKKEEEEKKAKEEAEAKKTKEEEETKKKEETEAKKKKEEEERKKEEAVAKKKKEEEGRKKKEEAEARKKEEEEKKAKEEAEAKKTKEERNKKEEAVVKKKKEEEERKKKEEAEAQKKEEEEKKAREEAEAKKTKEEEERKKEEADTKKKKDEGEKKKKDEAELKKKKEEEEERRKKEETELKRKKEEEERKQKEEAETVNKKKQEEEEKKKEEEAELKKKKKGEGRKKKEESELKKKKEEDEEKKKAESESKKGKEEDMLKNKEEAKLKKNKVDEKKQKEKEDDAVKEVLKKEEEVHKEIEEVDLMKDKEEDLNKKDKEEVMVKGRKIDSEEKVDTSVRRRRSKTDVEEKKKDTRRARLLSKPEENIESAGEMVQDKKDVQWVADGTAQRTRSFVQPAWGEEAIMMPQRLYDDSLESTETITYSSSSSTLTPSSSSKPRSRGEPAVEETRRITVREKVESGPRDVRKKPTFATRLTDRTAAQGSRIKLTCSVVGTPDPSVEWLKDGLPLVREQRYKTRLEDGLACLEVTNASPGDSAEYTCVARNLHGEATTSATLKVFAGFEPAPSPPTFTRSIKDTYKFSDDELTLECRVRSHPPPKISWLKDGVKIEGSRRHQQSELADGICRLVISSPDPSLDNGQYTCYAENNVWSDQISTVVQFEGRESQAASKRSRALSRVSRDARRPHLSNVLTDYDVPAGGLIALQIEAKGASKLDVTWMRGSETLKISAPKYRAFEESGVYTLLVADATEKEAGRYTCRVTNAYGHVDTSAAIGVVPQGSIRGGKPAMFINRPELDMFVAVGEDISVSFRVTGDPKPKVTWMKGIRDITNSQRSLKETMDDYVRLTLKRALVSDAGTYWILAKNVYGCDRAYFTVSIRQRARSMTPSLEWDAQTTSNILRDIRDGMELSRLKDVPGPVSGEPVVIDSGRNWLTLSWPKTENRGGAPVLAYRVEAWPLGGDGGARWVEMGVSPINTFDAFNLKSGIEYKFRVTPRNRYGWGESVVTSSPISVGRKVELPEFTRILPGQLKALQGSSISLECQVKGDPIPQVRWYKDALELNDPRFITSFDGSKQCQLNIHELRDEDTGRYMCEATNNVGRVSTFARLFVVSDPKILEADHKLKRGIQDDQDLISDYPPQFTMRLRDRRVQMTYPVRLTCQVAGRPTPELVWCKDGEELKQDDRHIFWNEEHFHTLEINRTTLEDSGCYSATARNANGAVSCRCNLVVDKGIRAYVAPEFFSELETEHTVKEGGELRLSAQVEAYPTVGVMWHRDGVRLRPSRRIVMTLDHDGTVELALAGVTARDAGVYSCTATNEVGRAETSIRVNVQVPETTPTSKPPQVIGPEIPYSKEPLFITKPRSTEAVEGDMVIILCEVVGDPKPEVVWLRDWLKPDYYRDAPHFRRVGDGPQYRLEIPRAKLDFTGAYSVIARNSHGEAKAVISLQIYAKGQGKEDGMEHSSVKHGKVQTLPVIKRELKDLRCCDGDAVTLECSVQATPEPDIRWEKGGRLLPLGGDFNAEFDGETARLHIHQVYPEDEGEYTCVAYNELGRALTSACLVVDVPEEKETLLSRQLSRPPGLLSAGSTPRSTPRTTPSRSKSPSVPRHREGTPSRYIFEESRPRRLKVSAPKFYAVPHNRVAEEGETVRFQCAIAGHPTPWVTWDKDGILVTPSSRLTLTEKDDLRILEISEVTVEDAGFYRITLENEVGRVEASARLEVINRYGGRSRGVRAWSASPRTSPTFGRRLIGSAARVGSRLTLACDVRGSPTPGTAWYRNGELVVRSSRVTPSWDGRTARLEIEEVEMEDAGMYTCVAENDEGKTRCSARLLVLEKDDPSDEDRQPPVFLQGLPPQTVASDGEGLELQVRIQGTPPLDVVWVRDSVEIPDCEDFRYVDHGDGRFALRLTDVFPQDSGDYRCEVYNDHGDAYTSGSLLVKEGSTGVQFSKRPAPVLAAPGGSASFCARLHNCSTRPSVSWTVAGRPAVSPRYKVESEGNVHLLHISPVEASDSGQVTCVVRSGMSSDDECVATTELTVREGDLWHDEATNGSEEEEGTPAMLIRGPLDTTALRGDRVVLKATYVGSPKPLVRWLKAGHEMTTGGRVTITNSDGVACLVIENITGDDSGKYVVSVENNMGADCHFASVAVEGPADPPAGRPSVFGDGTSVNVAWSSSPYDGGCMVTGYCVEMRKLHDTDWQIVTNRCYSLSYMVAGLTPGEQYVFRVRAENAHGLSEASSESEPFLVGPDEEAFLPAFEPRIVSIDPGEDFKSNYDVLEELGKGRYGVVHKVQERTTGQKFAAKFIRCIKAKDREKVQEEIDIMNILRHPKLLQLAAAFESPREIVMVMEYISGGELFERVVADDFTLTERDCILFMRQICEGVDYMHQNLVVHLDLKPENIMCHTRTSHQIKLIDFGLAQKINPDSPVRVLFGTPEFIPPEIINYEPIGVESDMWSVGVICYVLLSGLSPFMGDNDAETFANITRADYDFDDEAFDAISQDAKDFISTLLVKRKEKRLTARECLQHTWLAQHAENMSCVRLCTDKLKKFIIRRKWQLNLMIKRQTA